MCEEIQRNSQSCEDILGVVSLPLEIAQSEQSSFLDEYMNTKYQEHENRREQIQSEIKDVNMIIDENIRQCKDLFKEEMYLIVNKQYHPSVSDIESTDQWLAVSDEHNKRTKQINAVMNEYYLDIKGLEQNRSEKIEQLLSNYKEDAIKSRFCSPGETYKLLEEVVFGFNVKMLNNVQQHEDYKLQLQSEVQLFVDECVKHIKNKATYLAEIRARNLWKKIKYKQSQRLVVDIIFNFTQDNLKAREEISQATSDLVIGLSEFADVLKIPSDFEIDEEFWKLWIEMLSKRLESFESLCQRVHVLLKTAVTSLLETFDDKINSLTRTLYPNVGMLSESACEINGVSNEIQILKDERAKELKLILGNWQEMIDALSRKINQSKVFVSDLTLIWTNHMKRRNKLQADLEVDLENQKRKCLKEESTMNLKIKRQIKAIQEAKDLQKLNHSCTALENTLSDLKEKWENSYETQLQKIEAVRRNGIDPLIERKMSEIEEFLLVKYPKIQWLDESFSLKLKSSGSDLDNQIKMCNNYMKSVDNRTLGMYEMLERYLPVCDSEIREESEDWLYVCIQDTITNYETQLEEIKERHETKLETLKQMRSAELQMHSDRLLSHSSGIKSVLTNLNKQYEETKIHQNSQIANFNEKVLYISKNQNNLNSSKQIKDSISQMNQDWVILCKSLEDRISEAKGFCCNEINLLNNSNSMFCLNVKSFKNGGNYSPEELKTIKKEIRKLNKLIMSHNKTLTNNYNTLSKCISSTVFDATINELKNKHDKINLEEYLISSIKTIRFRLRTSASNLKAMGDAVERNIAHISIDNEKWVDAVREIIEIGRNRINRLMLPSELLTLECFSNINKIVTGSMKASENVKHDAKFTYIADEIPNISESYLGESKECILNQFSNMVQYIEKVFKVSSPTYTKKDNRKKSKSTNQYKNEPDDEIVNHINQLKSTLLHYYDDCKAVCIQQSQIHQDQMNRLQAILNLCVKQKFNNVHKAYILGLNNLEKWYGKMIAEECEVGEINRNKIKRNLVLPLAHPNHKHKLSELFEKAKETCKTQNKDFRELLSTYKGNLQSMHDKHVEQISTLRKNLESIQSIVFNVKLSSINLLDTSILSCNNSGYEKECNVDETRSQTYPLSIWSEIGGDVLINEKLKNYLSKSGSQEVRTDSQALGELSTTELATESLKGSAEHIQKLYDEARYKIKCYEETNKRWLELFQYDMNQAKLIHDLRNCTVKSTHSQQI